MRLKKKNSKIISIDEKKKRILQNPTFIDYKVLRKLGTERNVNW